MSLDIKIYQRAFQRHATTYIKAFIQGLQRHGIDAAWKNDQDYSPCDLAVIWGHRHPHIIAGQKESGKDYLVMERGYFGDRMKYCSLGYNGLNGRAEFHAENSSPDRWEKHAVDIEPWKIDGKYILLMGQVSGDQSLQGINIRNWYREVIEKIRNLTNMPVFFRPHPVARRQEINLDCDRYERGTLAESFQDAYLAITFSSNSGVDAVINGIPTIAMDRGSMTWDYGMARHEISLERYTPNRTQWLYDLAYKQWTIDEMARGEAWEHLRQRYE